MLEIFDFCLYLRFTLGDRTGCLDPDPEPSCRPVASTKAYTESYQKILSIVIRLQFQFMFHFKRTMRDEYFLLKIYIYCRQIIQQYFFKKVPVIYVHSIYLFEITLNIIIWRKK